MGKIHVLPEQLANQIAAGEVVERPASVVKELAENSLDAGATSIRIELAEGGLRRIVVADDGAGMSAEDARTCLERHATSKLIDEPGLSRIVTMGFRGEALPAIASVSRFTLTTREKEADAATRLVVSGGHLDSVESAGAPPGTTIFVEDLFFNTPARRKFLKRPETEVGHTSETVIRLALARPDVGFTFTSNGRTSFTVPANQKDPRERIAAALGAEVFKHLLPVDSTQGGIRVHGHLASPEFTMSTAKGLYTFVNRRFVRDRGLIAAVQRAFADVSTPGRQPAAVLFLEVPLGEVDVNVHPQKLEVRFSDTRRVFDAVYGALHAALRSAPWLATRAAETESADGYRARIADALGRTAGTPPRMPEGAPYLSTRSAAPIRRAPEPLPLEPAGQALELRPIDRGPAPQPSRGFFSSLKIIGPHGRGHLVCEGPGESLVIIDQHAALERTRFQALRAALLEQRPEGQPFLFPASVELPLGEARAITVHLEQARALGFDLEPFGGTSFALKSVPAVLVGCDYRKLLIDLGAQLLQVESGKPYQEALLEALGTMACHAAARAQKALLIEEWRSLLDGLDGADFEARCPHGRVVVLELGAAELG